MSFLHEECPVLKNDLQALRVEVLGCFMLCHSMHNSVQLTRISRLRH